MLGSYTHNRINAAFIIVSVVLLAWALLMLAFGFWSSHPVWPSWTPAFMNFWGFAYGHNPAHWMSLAALFWLTFPLYAIALIMGALELIVWLNKLYHRFVGPPDFIELAI